jgi:tripartite-type tricarboxylate transporter receptor subunit TctC
MNADGMTMSIRTQTFAYVTALLVFAGTALTSEVQAAATANTSGAGRPIQMIVPFAAGGPSDIIARVVGELLSKELNTNIVVVNRPGAGTAVGMQALAASRADGYTLGLATSSLISNRYTGLSAPEYTRFAPLAVLLNSPGALAVRSDSALRSLREFLKSARARDGSLTLGNTGAGGTWELMALILQDQYRVPFTSVPYNGGAPMAVALLGGQIDAAIQSVSGWASHVNGGKVKLLAIATEQRDRTFPNVSTFKEEGVDLVYGFWTGFLAPKNTPTEIVQRLSAALLKVAASPPFTEFAAKIATNVEAHGAQEFARLLKVEDDRIGRIAANIKQPAVK